MSIAHDEHDNATDSLGLRLMLTCKRDGRAPNRLGLSDSTLDTCTVPRSGHVDA